MDTVAVIQGLRNQLNFIQVVKRVVIQSFMDVRNSVFNFSN